MTAIETVVEAAFGYGFRDSPDDYVWVDISDYVDGLRPVQIGRGRQDEFSEVQPARCSLTLDNRDGRFTPANAAGAYFPNVRIRTPIRVSVEFDGVTYVRFVGSVDTWGAKWPEGAGASSVANVVATSGLPRLALGTFRPMGVEEFLRDDPVVFYPLTDAADAPEAVDLSRYAQPNLTTTATATLAGSLGGTSGVPTGDQTAMVPFGTNVDAWAPQMVGTSPLIEVADTGYTLEMAIKGTGPVTPAAEILVVQDESVVLSTSTISGDQASRVALGVDGSGYLQVVARVAGTNYTRTSATVVGTGSFQHVALTVTRAGGNSTPRLYVDGALVYTGATFPDHAVELNRLLLDGSNAAAYGYVAVHKSVLAADRIAEHADALLTGFTEDTSGERFERLMGYAGLEFDAETGVTSSVPLMKIDDRNPLTLLQTLNQAEGGLIFEDASGRVAFQGRDHRSKEPLSLTLSAAAQQIGADLDVTDNDAGLLNDVTAASTEAGIASFRAFDAESDYAYGPYRATATIPTTSADEVRGYAEWQVAKRAQELTRISSVSVDVGNMADFDIPALLSVELSDRIALADLPEQAPAASLECFVESITESISFTSYTTTFALSPAELFDAWVLDSATRSVLDATTVPLY